MNEDRLTIAIKKIDEANSVGPRVNVGGVDTPAELLYAERMTEVLKRLYPGARDLLAIAVRAQHIERWTVPRSTYPMDRQGYLLWRNDLKQFHASRTGEIMANCGYEQEEIARVQSLLRKEKLKRDPEAQALEDTACIVFLEFYADEFAFKHSDGKVIAILRKTWVKMSDKGRDAALGVNISAKLGTLLRAALTV